KEKATVTKQMASVLAGFTEGFSFAYLKELFLASLVSVATETEVEQAAGEMEVEAAESASSDSTVVVETADAVTEGAGEVSEGAGKVKEAETPAVEKKKEKEVVKPISDDEVPEELKDNIFFRVLCQQITSLRRDMNDKGDEKDEEGGEPGYGFSDDSD
ncbi:hypothetical protein V491_03785, partial [Pseudogymnoascus sp. VKM F-3775]